MGEEIDVDIESQLRRWADGLAEQVPITGPPKVLRATTPPRPGPWTRWRATTWLVAASVLAVVGVVAWTLTDGDGATRVRTGDQPSALTTTAPSAAAPRVGDRDFELWTSTPRVGRDRGPIVMAVLSPAPLEDVIFGVSGELDRWAGDSWVPHRRWTSCTVSMSCDGSLGGPDEELFTISIGLRLGSLERLALHGVAAGWYRLRKEANDGRVASTVIEVTDDQLASPPLPSTGGPQLDVSPALVLPAGAQAESWVIDTSGDGTSSLSSIEALDARLARTASVERWIDGAWQPAGVVELSERDACLGLTARRVSIPPLASGTYRLRRTDGAGIEVSGWFWVDVRADQMPAPRSVRRDCGTTSTAMPSG